MTEELITPENLSQELLKTILEAAYMDVSIDADGDLKVRDKCVCFVVPNQERKDNVQLQSIFRFKENTTELERLRVLNRINNGYIIVKATMSDNSTALVFRWDIPISGGITRKAFVLALKRFCSIPHAALSDCTTNEVA